MISPNKSSDLTSQANKTDATHKNIHTGWTVLYTQLRLLSSPSTLTQVKTCCFCRLSTSFRYTLLSISVYIYDIHCQLCVAVVLGLCQYLLWVCLRVEFSLHPWLFCVYGLYLQLVRRKTNVLFKCCRKMAYRKRNIYPTFQVWVIPLYIYRYSHFGIGLQQE